MAGYSSMVQPKNNGIYTESSTNSDGSLTAPKYHSSLGNDGTLKSQYKLTNTMDQTGLNNLRSEANRDAGSSSVWGNMAQQKNQSNYRMGVDDLGRTSNANLQSSFDSLGASGGLGSGARERIASSNLKDQMMARQAMGQDLQDQNLQVSTQDEQNRINMLQNMPGIDQSAANFDMGIQDMNTSRALDERKYVYDNVNNQYLQGMDSWAAMQQSNAQSEAAKDAQDSSLFGKHDAGGLGLRIGGIKF